jgi:hypothetical protein
MAGGVLGLVCRFIVVGRGFHDVLAGSRVFLVAEVDDAR